MANAFMLAFEYGYPRLMSSYNWPRRINSGGNGEWICEHRWRQITNMVKLHNAGVGQRVSNWWDNGYNAIAFSRGNRAFFAMNNEGYAINQQFQTGLPAGEYCDVISCDTNRAPCGGSECRGSIRVGNDGLAQVSVPNDDNPMVAYHV